MSKSKGSMIKDDMLFKPYSTMGGWQCIMQIRGCRLSVRFGGYGLITKSNKPYEVWYPSEFSPTGRQTADDIWNYINKYKS